LHDHEEANVMATYLIVGIDVKDPAAFERYRAEVPPFIAKHGGKYLVRGGAFEVVEGDWRPNRVVLLEFPDRAAARAFLDDPGYRPVAEMRYRSADTDIIMVDGL
jgi:uncharacterized protein (DUF1330 family)